MPNAAAPNFLRIAVGLVLATIVVVIVALIVFKLLSKVYYLIARKVWDWDELARRFPPRDLQKTGDVFRGGGFIGGKMRFTFDGRAKPFAIESGQQGLLIAPSFAADTPIFIPWASIREASWVDGLAAVLTLTIENERTLQFYLPQAAVPVVHHNIAAERFHKQSLRDLVNNRL